jgi:hypothetical protein
MQTFTTHTLNKSTAKTEFIRLLSKSVQNLRYELGGKVATVNGEYVPEFYIVAYEAECEQ